MTSEYGDILACPRCKSGRDLAEIQTVAIYVPGEFVAYRDDGEEGENCEFYEFDEGEEPEVDYQIDWHSAEVTGVRCLRCSADFEDPSKLEREKGP